MPAQVGRLTAGKVRKMRYHAAPRVSITRRGALALLALGTLLVGGCRTFSPSLPDDLAVDGYPAAAERGNAFEAPEALAQFNSPPSSTYRIGPGDVITIDVWSRPELSGKHIVGPDGYVSLPVVGPVKLAELDRDTSIAAVKNRYDTLYDDTIVTITVDEYVSNRILILGRVTNPGALQFVNPPTLLEAITLAGGLPIGGIGADNAALTRCAVFRGRDRVVWINLKDLLTGRDLSLNIQLQADDLVYLPDADDQLIYALGELVQPGAYHLTPEMTLLDVVARAGGLTEHADSARISLVRPSENSQLSIDLRDLLSPDPSLNVSLKQGDVLYVPTSGLGKVGYIMRQINPLTNFIIFTDNVGN